MNTTPSTELTVHTNEHPDGRPMRLVYIAGPYRAATPWRVQANIRRANERAAQFWARGDAAVAIHHVTSPYPRACPEEQFLRGGLLLLRQCDLVALTEGWEESAGTIMELREAFARGIAVVDEDDLVLTEERFERVTRPEWWDRE